MLTIYLIAYKIRNKSRVNEFQNEKMFPIADVSMVFNDFYDKFIRADIVSFDNLMECGSNAEARSQGKLRTEGRDYVVKDGDVVVFKV